MNNHNVIHSLDDKPLQVLFMLRKGLERALIEEPLKPGAKYEPIDQEQIKCVRDFPPKR